MIGDFAARVQQGLEQLERERFAEAEQSFRAALRMNPRDDQLLHLIGIAQFRQGRAEEALKSVQRAISLTKRKADYHNTLGCLLRHVGRLDEALESFRRAQKLEPRSVDVLYNIGKTMYQRHDFRDAVAAFGAIVERAPNDLEAILCVARALLMAGEGDKAIDILREALARMAGLDALRNYLAHILLLEGRFREGWSYYLSGVRRASFLRKAERPFAPPEPAVPFPADLLGKTIVLHSDQGLGDDLFFLRFAPALRARGARVEAAIDARIVEMVKRSGVLHECFAATAETPKDPRAIPIGDLPGLLGADAATPVEALPLTPLAERVTILKTQLERLPRPLIGLAWRAGTPHEDSDPMRPAMLLAKELPFNDFSAFAARLPGSLIVIQRDVREGELGRLEAVAPGRVADFSELNADLEGMLALLSLLDDYVGVSSTNVHLSAGLRRAGRVLVARDWEFRWMARGSRSPWFPGWTVYRLGREKAWPVVLGEVLGDVQRAFPSA